MNCLSITHNRKCSSCGVFFRPHPRVRDRQKNCRAVICQKKRKRSQERAWLAKNQGYFQGRYANTKEWLANHGGYQAALRAKKSSDIQTQIPAKPLVQSVRLHLRVAVPKSDIQTLILHLVRRGSGFWVDGAPMQGP